MSLLRKLLDIKLDQTVTSLSLAMPGGLLLFWINFNRRWTFTKAVLLTFPSQQTTVSLIFYPWKHLNNSNLWSFDWSTQIISKDPRSDVGKTRGAKIERGLAEGEFPPSVACHKGFPQGSSPFLQALLPGNFKHENKRSRAVSYLKDGDTPMPRGTTRTYQMALQAVMAWSWEWWKLSVKWTEVCYSKCQEHCWCGVNFQKKESCIKRWQVKVWKKEMLIAAVLAEWDLEHVKFYLHPSLYQLKM